MRRMDGRIDEVTVALPTKVSRGAFEEVRDEMVKLPRAKEVAQLRQYVSEHIEVFKGDNHAFHRDFKT